MLKSAIVIGASGNIGRALTFALVKGDCQVTALARNRAPLESIARDIGPLVSVESCDCADECSVRGILESARKQNGRIDFLIHCAGIAPDPDVPLSKYSKTAWDATFRTYVDTFFVCFKEAIRQMQRGAHVVAVSSAVTRFEEHALPANLYVGHYAAAKAALDEFCKWARREAHERGILLSRISPGAVDTPFHRNTIESRRPRLVPMNRLVSRIVEALVSGIEIDEQMIA